MPFKIVPNGTSLPFLPIPDHDLTLATQQIDIWQYPLSQLWPTAEGLLSADELQRAKRYYFERHRRRFIVARAMLRLILSRYLGIPPETLHFETNTYGKPFLTHPTQIQFNLSHSQDLALLAIGQHYPMGIDIEFFSSRPFRGMSEHMFSDQEINSYDKVTRSMRSLAFFHVWAQKEAFIKATGMGLSYPTKTFDVPVVAPTNTAVHDRRHAMTWHIRSFMPKIACSAAICHHLAIQNLRYRVLDKDIYAFT